MLHLILMLFPVVPHVIIILFEQEHIIIMLGINYFSDGLLVSRKNGGTLC